MALARISLAKATRADELPFEAKNCLRHGDSGIRY
jgi:hypothetical protein